MRYALVAAFCLAAFLKFHAFWQAPGFEKDQRTFFWTESAMHYYMADKVAKGESLGDYDEKSQTLLNRDIAPAMPWIAGTLYRLWPGQAPLDVFISYLFILYSSLTVVAVYFWARHLYPGEIPALAAAFLYAASAPAFIRSAGAFIKEDLALPFLMLGFLFYFRRRAVPSALFILLALLSWHFSQFMLLCFSGLVFLSLFVNGKFDKDETKTLAVFTAILATGAGAFSMLRATAFLFSPAMALLYGILAYQYSKRAWAGAAAFSLALSVYFGLGLAEQSHVFGLVLDKIRFALMKPADPAALSYETRSNWIEDFNSPSLEFLLYTASFFLPLGIAGLALLARRRKISRQHFFIAGFGFIFLVFFAMARRMITIEIIFLAIAAGGLLTVTGRRARVVMLSLVLSIFGYECWKSYRFFEPNSVKAVLSANFASRDLPEAYTVAEHMDAINWIRTFVNPEHRVLASIGFSPVILAYTGRPIVIDSMFDAKEMRDKVQAYLEALYSDEDRFYDFVKKNGAKYFIYESRHMLMDGPNSDRYIAGKMHPGKDSAVFNFHFHPENLKHFQLVYQNTAYRMYIVDERVTPPPMLPIPVYDERALGEGMNAEVISFLQTVRNLTLLGFQYGGSGNVPAAVQYWEEVKRLAPYTVDIHAQLCLAYLITKNIAEATVNCRRQLELQPHSPTGRYHMALYDEQTAHYPEAVRELETVLRIDSRYKKAETMLRKLRP